MDDFKTCPNCKHQFILGKVRCLTCGWCTPCIICDWCGVAGWTSHRECKYAKFVYLKTKKKSQAKVYVYGGYDSIGHILLSI